ncbi:MAG: hypothetical protein KA953_00585 [Lachnospiraceae bacterium]|nr:hypothetical protein [Lachnospiraceae bacterium]
MKKNENEKKLNEVSEVSEVATLDEINEKIYVIKIGKVYLNLYHNITEMRMSKRFDDAYRFNSYHSANRIADIVGGEVLRVGAYSLMFLNSDGDIYRENNGKKGLNK